jgi:hypothetical protein
MFDVLIESDPNLKPRKTALSLAISLVLHGVILVLAIILPLFFTETLSPALVVTYLAAPPPPLSKPPRRKVMLSGSALPSPARCIRPGARSRARARFRVLPM